MLLIVLLDTSPSMTMSGIPLAQPTRYTPHALDRLTYRSLQDRHAKHTGEFSTTSMPLFSDSEVNEDASTRYCSSLTCLDTAVACARLLIEVFTHI